MKKKTEINYLYFGLLFLFILALTVSHFMRVSKPFTGLHLFFLLYALGQALLEVLCCMLIGYFLHRWMPRWTFRMFIGLSFVFLLAHFVNFTMVRLMDVTISYVFQFFFGGGFSIDNFRVAFVAINMNSTMIALIVATTLIVPLAGIGLYWATQQVTDRNPLAFSQKQILAATLAICLLLLTVDIVSQPYISGDVYRKYKKTLPLGATFIPPPFLSMPLSAPIAMPRSETKMQDLLSHCKLSASKHPNLYLFVVETLRRDFMTEEVSPNLFAFQQRHGSPPDAYANANSTLCSWFSIFHSCYPYQWTRIRDEWQTGSVPLQLLKQLGYKINVYTAADLSYFSMDQILFGKERSLIDSFFDASQEKGETCEKDRIVVERLKQDLREYKDHHLFIIFLDSTHSEYSFPQDFEHPFQPLATSIDYLSISRTDDLERLKNRYKTAIHWVDHLIGDFFHSLQSLSLYDDAVIAITGDHGEEFFEEGALFHGTHLNEWQTRVPLYYKFQQNLSMPYPPVSTHLDLFPSLLHYLTGIESWKDYMDGESMFAKDRWPFVLSVQHNGPDVPYEFSLSDGKTQLLGHFLTPPYIHAVPGIALVALKTKGGQEVLHPDQHFQEVFEPAFAPLIEKRE